MADLFFRAKSCLRDDKTACFKPGKTTHGERKYVPCELRSGSLPWKCIIPIFYGNPLTAYKVTGHCFPRSVGNSNTPNSSIAQAMSTTSTPIPASTS